MNMFSSKKKTTGPTEKDIQSWSDVLNIKTETLKAWRMQTDGSSEEIPEDDLGYFYNGEMYVVLKVINKNAKLWYNLHFWIGSEKAKSMTSSPPNQVNALNALLKDKVAIFREIEGFESPIFKKYFKVFGVQKGMSGVSFDPQNPNAYRKRLLHFRLNKDRRRTEVYEEPISWKSLTSGDVFIYDEGNKMTQWNGSRCDDEERLAARKYIESALKKRKCKSVAEFYDEEDLMEFCELRQKLGDSEVSKKVPKVSKNSFEKTLSRLSDESGKLVLNKIYNGKIFRNGINPNDVTFIETHRLLYVYIGPGASENEQKSCWDEAIKYLNKTAKANKTIALFYAGTYVESFQDIWDDAR